MNVLHTDLARIRPAFRAAMLVVLCVLPVAAHAFALADVERRARSLARAAYAQPEARLPAELRELSYAQYQRIAFKPERAHWRGSGLPIELAFFHRGMAFDQAVKINEIADGNVNEIRYSADAFDFLITNEPQPT